MKNIDFQFECSWEKNDKMLFLIPNIAIGWTKRDCAIGVVWLCFIVAAGYTFKKNATHGK